MATPEEDVALETIPESEAVEAEKKTAAKKAKKKKKQKKQKSEEGNEETPKSEQKKKKRKKSTVSEGGKEIGKKSKKQKGNKNKEEKRKQLMERRASVAEAATSAADWLNVLKSNEMADSRDISVLLMFCMIYEADLPIAFYEQLSDSMQLKKSLRRVFADMRAGDFFKSYSAD